MSDLKIGSFYNSWSIIDKGEDKCFVRIDILKLEYSKETGLFSLWYFWLEIVALAEMEEINDFLDEREQFEMQYQQELEMMEEEYNMEKGKSSLRSCNWLTTSISIL